MNKFELIDRVPTLQVSVGCTPFCPSSALRDNMSTELGPGAAAKWRRR